MHVPNEVPKGERLFQAFLGVILLGYGTVGLVLRRLDLSRGKLRIAVFEGGPAVLLGVAAFVGAAILFSTLADHYDTRDNERAYHRFKAGALWLAGCLVAAALLAHLLLGFTR